jgi:hypothetical protein
MSVTPGPDTAADRARWLAELAHALEQARELVRTLGGSEGRVDAVDLAARIEAASEEVESMRLRRSSGGGEPFDPEWTKNLPWRLSA